MPMSVYQRAKRGFVQVLLKLASAYGLVASVNRDSEEDAIQAAYRRVVRHAHPDKGGTLADAQRLQVAKDEWDAARKSNQPRGRPRRQGPESPAAAPQASDGLFAPGGGVLANIVPVPVPRALVFSFQSTGVMFTYHIHEHAQWDRFLTFIGAQLQAWEILHWCATMETTKRGGLHVHMYVQFRRSARRSRGSYVFEGIQPHVSTSDYCGEGLCRKKLQNSIDRGMFYVWADKIGTVRGTAGNPCVAGNYMPTWTSSPMRYAVAGRWIDNLWKRHLLTHMVYEDYVFLARDGVVVRKRNLDACREREAIASAAAEMADRALRIRANTDVYRAFPEIPEVSAWQGLFREDALRYPILILDGPSFSGKTEYAKSLFPAYLELKVGGAGASP